MNRILFCALIVALLFWSPSFAYPNNYGNYDSIRLEDVKVLTFSKGQMTTGRRSAPIPQLHCVGGSAAHISDYQPHTVQCVNVGTDSYGEVQWKCEADLDSSVRFGQTTVACEGYSNPEDPYILKGSCGLEYALELTEQGKQKNQNQGYGSYYSNNQHGNYYTESSRNFNWGNVVMLVILGIIVVGLLNQCSQNAARNSGGGGNSGNGFPPGGNGYPQGGNGYPPGGNSYPPGCAPTTGYGGNTFGMGFAPWRPGFWTGFGTGGFLGYLLRPRTHYGNYGYNYQPGPTYRTGWGGGGGGSFGSTMSGPRTATTYASTRRR